MAGPPSKRVAALAQTEWDKQYADTPNKRAWIYKVTGSKSFWSKGKGWTSDVKGELKERRRGGKRR